jgi:hypothetical protein
MSRPLIIAGMYHSGTTYFARRLEELGWQMCGAEGYHDAEHWECAEVFGANQREYLRRNPGGRRAFEPRRADGSIDYRPSREHVNWLVQYRLRRQMQADGAPGGAAPGGFKEPGIALYPEAYFAAFQGCRFLLCCRNPMRVAVTARMRGVVPNPRARMVTWGHTFGRFLGVASTSRPEPDLFLFNYDADPDWMERQGKALNEWAGADMMGGFEPKD